ncbi:OXA-286 family class D beta-lactamase OXA-293 [Acinetobacter sp. NIPH 1958]|uniref:OXA-286 family carbapenem-hydrolyzing class D beta-lactamase OXA-293 n=1 Tax=unclassified Acinetobacter TaxID=196816 RepID=UPI0003AA4F31|nr:MULTISPECIES: OXA-286 family carbapenem-hydrolyzing class D beta-lactamase OXA-293 [unclassified Acinetobacter]MCH7351242.1 OXA-286 family class D beta-lactamase OXA-293 [Acinetobacter sp. NIPH 2023]MCH7357349.1 OXA-286 family class D beta-lactamase OXA-293 [Acinetobacter sp. NIPH 1958]MCH7359095.1 OXA-286 family class D beta-lactamase OXA-293 [Acinetobacter sp. NIPH 2024]
MSAKLKILTLSISLVLGLPLMACQSFSQQKQQIMTQKSEQQQIASLFQNAQTSGVLVIYDGKKIQKYGNDTSRAEHRYIPASTFKMLNALIGIQHHKTTPNEIFKWDGRKRAFSSWEKDLTLAEAMQASAVPVYQELARRIGLELMTQEIKRVGYGNNNVGTQVDNFWLVGPLKITPVEEVRFAYALAKQKLPFDQSTQQQVKGMLLLDEVQGAKIYAKSGWGMDVSPQVGWWTGWIEQANGKITAFSLNMEMSQPEHAETRKAIVYQALQQLDLLVN